MFKTNEYFDGKVKSIAFQTETLPATVGVMATGNYIFNTAEKEKITVVSGSLTIKLSGEETTTTYSTGESFDVTVNEETAYLCLYG